MVIDLAIEDERVVIVLRTKRLTTGSGIDYPEAGRAQGYGRALPSALIVRATVKDGSNRLVNPFGQKEP
jgi:hypothetical protein